MHLLGQFILEENAKQTRSDVLGQLMEFKKLQKQQKIADAGGEVVNTRAPVSKENIAPVTPSTAKTDEPAEKLTKAQKNKLKKKSKKAGDAPAPAPKQAETSKPGAPKKPNTTPIVLPKEDPVPLLCDMRKDYGKLVEAGVSTLSASYQSLYIGDKSGYMTKVSIDHQTVSQKIGYVHNETIFAMAISEDDKYLFTGDCEGILKQTLLEDSSLAKNYGRICDAEIKAIAVCGDNLFVADFYGSMKQISISEHIVLKNYGKIHKSAIWSMCCTRNGEYLYTSDAYGYLQQYSIKSQSMVKNFGYIHDAGIRAIVTSWDNKWLFTADRQGNLKQFSVKDKIVVKEYGKVMEDEILDMASSPSFVFVTSITGGMKQFNIETQTMVQDFGKIHDGYVLAISVTPNGQILFTSDDLGNLKQFRINDEWVEKVSAMNQSEVFEVIESSNGLGRMNSLKSNAGDSVRPIAPVVANGIHEAPVVVTKELNLVKDKVGKIEARVEEMSSKMEKMDGKLDMLLAALLKK
jgi:WD40 repeat protein